MDFGALLRPGSSGPPAVLFSPLTFALLLMVAVAFVWLGFRPSAPTQTVRTRLDGYLERDDIQVDDGMNQPFIRRVLVPPFRSLIHLLGGLLPRRILESAHAMLQQAGQPGGLTAIDFLGVRVLMALLLGVGYFVRFGTQAAGLIAARNGFIAAALGFFLPYFWLRNLANARRHQILRAMPDGLDMLTIGVEAGLAFESAMVKLGEKWDNPLTREFSRAVAEMRVGTSRDVALQRMAARCGVQELDTFVAVLVQSSQLGVSIAQVLHTQADQMRTRRRQRAEELARQAGVKMVFPLVFFIFPAMFAVILGPAVPSFLGFFAAMSGGK